MPTHIDKVSELKDFYQKLIEYNGLIRRYLDKESLTNKQKGRMAELFETIGRRAGYLGKLITELTGIEKVDVHGKEHDMWTIALRLPVDKLASSALGYCIQVTIRAIGQLEDDIKGGIRDKQGKRIIEKPPELSKKPAEVIGELSIQLFDKMQFHPRIIRASKSLFNSGHYAEAIFAAFKAVNNFTKKKAGLSLDGKDLMAKTFNEDQPIIKLNKLLTRSELDEQEGFRFLFMGAMVGIRNPKAHDEIRQINLYRTLEYLAFASLLMRRVTEGKLESGNK